MKVIKYINFLVFTRALSVFDIFWINFMINVLLGYSGWFILVSVPLMFISLYMMNKVEEESEDIEDAKV